MEMASLAAAVLAGKAGMLNELLLVSGVRDMAWRLEQRLSTHVLPVSLW